MLLLFCPLRKSLGEGDNFPDTGASWSLWNNPTRSVSLEGASGGVGNEQRTADGVIQNDRWQMLTYVIDTTARTVTVYVDGVVRPINVMSGTGELGVLASGIDMNRAWRIGGMMDGHFMSANLGRFTVWKRALSACEIAADFGATRGTYPNP
jgi:hypothetical protein